MRLQNKESNFLRQTSSTNPATRAKVVTLLSIDNIGLRKNISDENQMKNKNFFDISFTKIMMEFYQTRH